jgi:hypothetical protein
MAYNSTPDANARVCRRIVTCPEKGEISTGRILSLVNTAAQPRRHRSFLCSMWHGADTDGNSGDRNYLVLAKPNVNMNDPTLEAGGCTK